MDTVTRDLTAGLLPVFPDFGPEGRRLARSLMPLLARGFPVSPSVLAKVADLSPARVDSLLAGWWGARLDSDGRIIGAWGLDLFPTRHQLRVPDRDLFAWCAWDALTLPGLIGEEAEVTSLCPASGDDIRLRVAPQGLLDAEPEDARLALKVPAAGSGADIRRALRGEVRFLAGRQAAAEWQGERPGARILSLEEGDQLGRTVWQALLGAG